ncbi:IclR family transcriptional regulator [Pseudonocardia xishanensis]|uniref:IclR family transcriptional regulator n=1 Tax=Pseudonocardia xishanensis TaxID=630995 RepID=A0ABP8S1U6_9PSEU
MPAADDGESTLSRATRVLEVFGPGSQALSASEISRRTRIPMASTHRLVGEMVRLGLLERGPDKLVRVGVRLWELGWRSTAALGLRNLALPYLEDLQSVVRHHTLLAVLDGTEVLYLERLSARGPTTVNITRVAGRLPAHSCPSGVLLLAFSPPELQEQVLATHDLVAYTPHTPVEPQALRQVLADTRQRGTASLRGTVHLDAAGVAAPVRDHTGAVVAALTVIVPNDSATIAAARPAVVATARAVTRALQSSPAHLPGRVSR